MEVSWIHLKRWLPAGKIVAGTVRAGRCHGMASLSCRSRQTVIAVLSEIGRSVVRAGVRLVLGARGTVVGRRHMVRVAERTH
jgi:hypothetical protein